jgi:phosphate transport system protein
MDMAGLSEAALRAGMQALTQANRQMAYSVILRDQYIDELETELDQLCLEFLARHQPVAQDLRFIFSTIQINRELERIGDYAESIARQVLAISHLEPQPQYEKFVELGDVAVHMLRDSVHAFLQPDASLAERTMVIEERANQLRNTINGELRDLTHAGKLPVDYLTPLMTVARRLERVTDQAKNLCEEVLYMCTGQFVKHKSADGFRILFVDETNGCLSQMAEGIGRSLKLPHFEFRSAGITPQPMDTRVVDFLTCQGSDASSQSSKSVEQIEGWENYQVVVCFGGEVREAIPPHPGKTIYFTWKIKDPSKEPGCAETARSPFETAYHKLEAHIKELVGAILQEPQPETK